MSDKDPNTQALEGLMKEIIEGRLTDPSTVHSIGDMTFFVNPCEDISELILEGVENECQM
jgi:hypothetical protein